MSYNTLFKDGKTATNLQVLNVSTNTTPLGVTPMAISQYEPAVMARVQKALAIKDDDGISQFGTEAGKEVAALSDKILQQTTTGKMDEFGKGITDILSLTASVNIDDLNINKNKGMVGKVTGFFKKKQVEVVAQFQSTSTSIQKVADNLATRQLAMKSDNKFLDELYDKNMNEYHELGQSIQAIEIIISTMNKEYEELKLKAENSTDQFFVQSVVEAEQRIKRWEKQTDRLKRMQHVALLTALRFAGSKWVMLQW